MTAHQHHWAADRDRTGFSCMEPTCQVSGWDWQQDEIRRLSGDAGYWEAVAERNALSLAEANGRERGLRAELQTWQQRFGDCEATVLRMEAVISAATAVDTCTYTEVKCRDGNCHGRLHAAIRALDAVPRRACTVPHWEEIDGPVDCFGRRYLHVHRGQVS